MKNNHLLILLISALFLSCQSDRINSLESKIYDLENKLDNFETPSNTSVKTGILRVDEKVENKNYWDISTHTYGIHFVYHRKNKGEMWQPVFDSYISSGTVRISDENYINSEEYLIVTIPGNY